MKYQAVVFPAFKNGKVLIIMDQELKKGSMTQHGMVESVDNDRTQEVSIGGLLYDKEELYNVIATNCQPFNHLPKPDYSLVNIGDSKLLDYPVVYDVELEMEEKECESCSSGLVMVNCPTCNGEEFYEQPKITDNTIKILKIK